MELNLLSILYLAYRVAPLMIVLYFVFQSVINQDFKGLIYLIGLIFTCFIVNFLGSVAPADWLLYDIDLNSPVCNSFSIGQNGYYSNKFPFSVVVFSFTFFYIFYSIYAFGQIMENLPILALFPALILFDMCWNKIYKCSNVFGMGFSLIFGGGMGYVWGLLINMTGMANLNYMTGSLNNETCNIAASTQFKCTLRNINPKGYVAPPSLSESIDLYKKNLESLIISANSIIDQINSDNTAKKAITITPITDNTSALLVAYTKAQADVQNNPSSDNIQKMAKAQNEYMAEVNRVKQVQISNDNANQKINELTTDIESKEVSLGEYYLLVKNDYDKIANLKGGNISDITALKNYSNPEKPKLLKPTFPQNPI